MNKRSKYAIIETVVKEHQYTKISILMGTKRKSIILDVQTANLLYKLFNEAPPENKTKLEALQWHRLCNMAWSLVEGKSNA